MSARKISKVESDRAEVLAALRAQAAKGPSGKTPTDRWGFISDKLDKQLPYLVTAEEWAKRQAEFAARRPDFFPEDLFPNVHHQLEEVAVLHARIAEILTDVTNTVGTASRTDYESGTLVL